MKKYLTLCLIILITMFLNGCGSHNGPSLNEIKILSDTNKGFIVFSRPYSRGALYNYKIVEYDPENYDILFMQNIGTNRKTILALDEGEHYFYTDAGSGTSRIFKIFVKKGKKYYFSGNARPEMQLFSDERAALIHELKTSNCDQKILDKYLFNIKYNDTFSSPVNINIKCENDKITKIEDTINNDITIDELDGAQLIETTTDKKFYNDTLRKTIEEKYKIYEVKKLFDFDYITFKPFLKIEQQYLDENYKFYNGVNIMYQSSTNYDYNSEEKVKKIMSNYFSKFNGERVLDIKISINNYDSGSMFNRYLLAGLTDTMKDWGVINLSAEYFDKGKKIAEIKVTQYLDGGLFGGIDTLIEDSTKIINEYTQRNFIGSI